MVISSSAGQIRWKPKDLDNQFFQQIPCFGVFDLFSTAVCGGDKRADNKNADFATLLAIEGVRRSGYHTEPL
jgi:hypothetical protein